MPLICLEEMKEEIIKSILSTSNKSIKCTLVVLVQLLVFYVLFLSAVNSYHCLVHHVQIPIVCMDHGKGLFSNDYPHANYASTHI